MKGHRSDKSPGTSPGTPSGFSFETLISIMNGVGTIWIFCLLILINMDILGRSLFNHPIRGVPEIVALSIAATVFLQLAHTLKCGRLTRSDMFLKWLFRHAPRLGYSLQAFFHLVGSGLLVIIFWFSVPLLTKAWRIEEYVGAQGDFMAPVWPVKLIILIGCLATCLQFLLLTYRDVQRIIDPGREKRRDREVV